MRSLSRDEHRNFQEHESGTDRIAFARTARSPTLLRRTSHGAYAPCYCNAARFAGYRRDIPATTRSAGLASATAGLGSAPRLRRFASRASQPGSAHRLELSSATKLALGQAEAYVAVPAIRHAPAAVR